MTFFKALVAAMSAYSAIPMPRTEWDDESLKYAVCFLPAVGAVCAAALFLWYRLCLAINAGGILFSSVAVCLPLIITGGIHMDGFMDTVDALASHQGRERMLEIMKDSSCGAFSIIYFGVYMLLSLGVFCELYSHGLTAAACPVYILSRALCAICTVRIPYAKTSVMLRSFTSPARKNIVTASMTVLLLACAATMTLLSPSSGGLAIAFALICTLAYRSAVIRLFGGITGDTSGFLIMACELCALLGVLTGGLII